MSFFFSRLQATLAILDKLDIETENPTEEEVARKFGWEDDYLADDLSLWQRVKPKIFSLFDEPHSSTCARVSISTVKKRLSSGIREGHSKHAKMPNSNQLVLLTPKKGRRVFRHNLVKEENILNWF